MPTKTTSKSKGATNVANTNENEKRTPKQLVLRDADGGSWTLQFNRKIVLQMQRNGFVLDLDRLYMCARDLIQGAFKMHHPWLKWDQIESIWTFQGSKRGELLGYLANMFSAPALELMGDGSDEDDKTEPENPTFEIVW